MDVSNILSQYWQTSISTIAWVRIQTYCLKNYFLQHILRSGLVIINGPISSWSLRPAASLIHDGQLNNSLPWWFDCCKEDQVSKLNNVTYWSNVQPIFWELCRKLISNKQSEVVPLCETELLRCLWRVFSWS